MYHTESISKLFDKSGPNALHLMKFCSIEELNITSIEDRILVAKNYTDLGSPEDLNEFVKDVLGEEADTYLNPSFIKAYSYGLEDLLDTKDLLIAQAITTRNTPLFKSLLDIKLSKYLVENHLTALEPSKKFAVQGANHTMLVFKIKSIYSERSLIKITLSQKNYKYSVEVVFLNQDHSVGSLITDESLKKIKKLMFEMSGSGKFNILVLDQALPLLEFKDLMLDCFLKNLINHLKQN